MTGDRQPAVSGSFYPADASALKACVAEYLAPWKTRVPLVPALKAVIAPHAGYRYSGHVAGAAYAVIRQVADTIRRVVLLGPSHRVPLAGMALSSAEAFVTPLGKVSVDQQGCHALQQLPAVNINDLAHQFEHSLEVQLPFLQSVLASFRLVPLVVGEVEPKQVARVLDTVIDDTDTLIVVSSDLSHYLSYLDACRVDRDTASRILAIEPDLSAEQACGCFAVNGLLSMASRRAMTGRLLALGNSGDTAGTKDRVVGYGSFAFGSS